MRISTIFISFFILLVICTAATANINITLHEAIPTPLNTNYTGCMCANYIVESDTPLNFSSIAFLAGINNTVTGDMHSFIKVPANDIASEGFYRANFRNTTPKMLWTANTTLTGDNVWQWSGYDNNSVAITKTSINSTHTWINVTGHSSIVFPSMYYLDINKSVSAPMTGIEINRAQSIIFKVWDLEHLRGRNTQYYVNLFFDTSLEDTPNDNINLWYCNTSFNPLTDDPEVCQYCNRMDTWTSERWMDKCDIRFHSNSSYAKALTVNAGEHPDTPPDVINYICLLSGAVASKSYILNATNYDPNICNLTYAQTNTMWVRNELSGTNTPHAYTPSFYMTFVRDFIEFQHSLHIANDGGEWDHNYTTHPIGISNILPTHCLYNYFWYDNETDYNMNGTYTQNFWVNLTYGFDPDNDAPLSHVLELYDSGYNFIKTINTTLTGDKSDVDVYANISGVLTGNYRFKITSTDNENTNSVTWSNVFHISHKSSLIAKALLFFDEMINGFVDFKNDIGKYIVWAAIFIMVSLLFTLIIKIKYTLLGGK